MRTYRGSKKQMMRIRAELPDGPREPGLAISRCGIVFPNRQLCGDAESTLQHGGLPCHARGNKHLSGTAVRTRCKEAQNEVGHFDEFLFAEPLSINV